jgi:hypothetical protein
MNPCDKCPFEWYDLKHNTSCKDECEVYKKWVKEKADVRP